MTYKKLLKEAKKHIRTRIIDYKPASSIHIAGINDNRKECEDPLQDYDPNYFIDKAIEITKGGGVDGN